MRARGHHNLVTPSRGKHHRTQVADSNKNTTTQYQPTPEVQKACSRVCELVRSVVSPHAVRASDHFVCFFLLGRVCVSR